MRRSSETSFLLPLAIVAAVLLSWELAVRLSGIKPYLLPAPSDIAVGLASDAGVIFSNLETTLVEILLGFAAAAFVAFVAGTAVAYSLVLRRAVYPLIVASQTVPVIAIAPVLIIWFGYNIWPRVIVTALVAFFPLTVNVVAGFASVEPELIVFFRSLNAGPGRIFFKLALPSALPFIFAGLRITAVLAVIGATVSEWIGSDHGLGHLIALDTSELDTVRVFASIAVLSVVGIVLFAAVVAVEWSVLPWRHSQRKISFWPRLWYMAAGATGKTGGRQ